MGLGIFLPLIVTEAYARAIHELPLPYVFPLKIIEKFPIKI
jgi:hypothetical protein